MSALVPITLADGELITKPGLYDVSIERYHSGQLCDSPAISSSGLRTIFTESPAHYWKDSPLNPERAEQKDKEAFILGRGAHHLILGEADFGRHFVLRPETYPEGASYPSSDGKAKPWSGNANWCKAWAAEQKDRGLTVLTPGQLEQIKGMADSLSRHPLVKAGILNGHVERTLAFKDSKTGVWVLARPDVIPNDSGDVADLKTTTDVSWQALERTLDDLRYDMQGALIRQALREVLGLEMQSFSLVWVEKTAPHCTEVSEVPLYDLDEADRDIRVALDLFAKCLRTGVWNGPGGTQTDAVQIPISERARKRAANHRTFLEAEIAA